MNSPSASLPNSVALVIGGSEKIIEEYRAAKALCADLAIVTFVANDMIADFPDRIDHAVTMHSYKLERSNGWLPARRRAGLELPQRVWSHPLIRQTRVQQPSPKRKPDAGVTDQFTDPTGKWNAASGVSSGTLAAKIAKDLGHIRIILCGVPLEIKAGHFKRRRDWTWAPTPQLHCKKNAEELRPYVRSMSGWTMQLFGFPDRAWLRAPVAHVAADLLETTFDVQSV